VTIRPLVDHLDRGRPRQPEAWQGWQIAPVIGGRNNLLYRARGPGGDLAIKFYRRDGRDRAGREYHALLALRRAGLALAPEPLLLDRERYGQPVGVQRWLAGEADGRPPEEDGAWRALAEHLARIHSVTPARTPMALRRGTIYATRAGEARQRVYEQAAHLPAGARPDSLQQLLARLQAASFPDWPRVPVALCRLDNNIANYVWRPEGWASVDWEYSGWNDPAFDVANLTSHVAWIEVPAWRWAWFVEAYGRLAGDRTVARRAEVYRRILLVWWAVRLARYLYDIPRGRDQRLADWPVGWQADIAAKYDHYVRLAEAAFPQ
jgi:thiamine kinase-like enzyme